MAQQTASGKSAGRPWWRVDEDGMRRHMSGQVVECFSGGEVKAILDVVENTGGDLAPATGLIALVALDSIDSRRDAGTSTSGMSIDSFDMDSTRILTYVFPYRTPINAKYPGTPPDQITIYFGGDYDDRVVCFVLKSADDYFYVRKNHAVSSAWPLPHDRDRVEYYICDGAVGLRSLLPLVLQGGPARSQDPAGREDI